MAQENTDNQGETSVGVIASVESTARRQKGKILRPSSAAPARGALPRTARGRRGGWRVFFSLQQLVGGKVVVPVDVHEAPQQRTR